MIGSWDCLIGPGASRTEVHFILGGAILLNQYAFSPTLGLEWFVPFLFLKLLLGHMLPEGVRDVVFPAERNDG